MDKSRLAQLCITAATSVREAIECIDRSGRVSVALVVDAQGRLECVLTDGDIRRGVLRGINLDAPVSALLPIKAQMPNAKAVTAPVDASLAEQARVMEEKAVRQLPLVDALGRVVDIVLRADLLPEADPTLQAVIMAGGFGTRLRPFTTQTPKPMLPVGGRPLMEHLIGQLQQSGIRRINIATHYQAEKIVQHFGDGKSFGVDIQYVREEQPLGTGGALRLLPEPDSTTLVINGDVLTSVNYQQMLAYHREQQADMTVAANLHALQVPYGVIDCDGPYITALREKPDIKLFVNAGIYLLEPSAYSFIPANQQSNMTDLIERLIASGRTVVSFPIREYWLDVGQHTDYARAQNDLRAGCLAAA